MTAIPDNTPVIIGVGQASERPDDPGYRALSHMDLAGEALREAIADCFAIGSVASAIDTIAAIRQFENSTPRAQRPFGGSNNPPRSVGRRVGADPARAILEISGGQGNQKLVGELATEIAAGRSRVAAIVGAEAISTVLTLTARGETPDWSEEVEGSLEDRGYGLDGLMDPALARHGAVGAIPVYALFDNARRAKLGLSPDAYRREIGALFAPFTEVASQNPHAASREVRSAEELATVTERNRIVAEPYTRMTVARDQVNQGAAILIASAGAARELGIPEDRWVHIHGVSNAMELTPLRRPDLAESPASWRSLDAALDIAGRSIADMAFLDFYSCFAIAVFNAIDHFGIAADDPRGLTLTGGLPFFGGAGNNYSAHAIVEAVQRLRAMPGSFGLVGANGGVMSKYASGVYSTAPADWSAGSRWTKLADEQGGLPLAEVATGEASIDSYTFVPGKGDPLAIVIARNDRRERLVARAMLSEPALRERFERGDVFGARISVATDDKGRSTFSLVG
ncbi:MAG: acetyl-CoA acetyltransferase [Novosphingobium sp.]|nr:acetyl-CoA acetyltransferase [Novosphingobium sp.]